MFKKIFILLSLSLSLFAADSYKGYISSHELIFNKDQSNRFVVNIKDITFKSGLELTECIVSSYSDSNIDLICISSNLNNLYIKLESVKVLKDSVKIYNPYFNAYEIKIDSFLKK